MSRIRQAVCVSESSARARSRTCVPNSTPRRSRNTLNCPTA
jgi:hypothetical protein